MIQKEGNPEWKELKSKIKNTFGKLSEPDVNKLNGHMDRLRSTVQKAYHYDNATAEKECEKFNQSLKKK